MHKTSKSAKIMKIRIVIISFFVIVNILFFVLLIHKKEIPFTLVETYETKQTPERLYGMNRINEFSCDDEIYWKASGYSVKRVYFSYISQILINPYLEYEIYTHNQAFKTIMPIVEIDKIDSTKTYIYQAPNYTSTIPYIILE